MRSFDPPTPDRATPPHTTGDVAREQRGSYHPGSEDPGTPVRFMPGWPDGLPWPPPLDDSDVPVEQLFGPDAVQAAPQTPGCAPARVPLPDPPANAHANPILAAWQDPDQPPIDLTVINEHPALAELILWLRQIDVLTANCVQRLAQLDTAGEIPTHTGVSMTGWLSAYGRRTGNDIRMLRATVRQLARIPTLNAAFHAGQVSWAQVRAVVLHIQRLPARYDDTIDAAVSRAIDSSLGAQPDALVTIIRQHVNARCAEHDNGKAGTPTSRDFLGMQPFPDATGGRIFGEVDAEGWAIIDAALNRHLPPPNHATRHGFAGDPTTDQPPGHHHPTSTDTGRHRLQRLLAILDATLTPNHPHHHGRAADSDGGDNHDGADDHGGDSNTSESDGNHDSDHNDNSTRDGDHDGDRGDSDGTDDGGDGDGGDRTGRRTRISDHPDLTDWWAGQSRSRPQLIVRAELSALLDRSQTPASLLTTLLGGQTILTAAAARTLIDTRGADLRTIILNDTGEVVGVGRRTRVPPGWLRDAILALHDTCTAPTCTTPALLCDLDHATPWHPARPGDPQGRTDIDQLAPLCRRDNTAKESEGWRATQHADGTRRWQHHASGYDIRTIPATWQPPPHPGDPP